MTALHNSSLCTVSLNSNCLQGSCHLHEVRACGSLCSYQPSSPVCFALKDLVALLIDSWHCRPPKAQLVASLQSAAPANGQHAFSHSCSSSAQACTGSYSHAGSQFTFFHVHDACLRCLLPVPTGPTAGPTAACTEM